MVVAGVSVHRYARLEGPLHKGTETWIQYLLNNIGGESSNISKERERFTRMKLSVPLWSIL